MVWFHGGGHSSGVGSATIFDGTAMATKGVLMVTANYRLGPLGFHRAIGQSGGCLGAPRRHLAKTDGVATETSGHDAGLAMAAALGIDGDGADAAAALRAIDPEALLEAQRSAGQGTPMARDSRSGRRMTASTSR